MVHSYSYCSVDKLSLYYSLTWAQADLVKRLYACARPRPQSILQHVTTDDIVFDIHQPTACK